MTNARMLKNGTQVCSGKNFWAKARAKGEVIQLTFMTSMKPALTVALTWWKVLAPAMMAIEARYTEFWIGAICTNHNISFITGPLPLGMIETYDQIADENLQDLGLQASPSSEHLLQYIDQKVSQWRADEGSIDRHLRHTRVDVAGMFANVLGDPRRKDFLYSRECAGSEHLCAQRVLLELLEVGLAREHLSVS